MSSNTKWTSGPWAFVTRGYFDGGDEIWSLGNEDDPIQFPVADFGAGGEPYPYDRELIALAPEMAAALMTLTACYEPYKGQIADEAEAWEMVYAVVERLRMIGADE